MPQPVVISMLLMGFVTRPTRLKIRYGTAGSFGTFRSKKRTCVILSLIRDSWISVGAHDTLTMAIARPIRVLAFTSLLLCIFVLYQVFSPAGGPPKSPGTGIAIDKDPNLERMCPLTP